MTLAMTLTTVAGPSFGGTAPTRTEEISSQDQDLERAVSACEFALVVWDTPAGAIRVANQAAAELFGLPLEAVPGQRMADLFTPRERVDDVVAAFSSKAVDRTRTDRQVHTGQGDLRKVRIWSRTVELAETSVVASLVVPSNETARLGRDPAAPWRDLAPIAVGFTDGIWRIEQVSRDIVAILRMGNEELVGVTLLDLLHPDDAAELRSTDGRVPRAATAYNQLRMRDAEGFWVDVCLLTAPLTENGRAGQAFALVGPPTLDGTANDRVSELEMRLRHIGAEVRAAGLLDDMKSIPRRDEFPELAHLTSRQWEVLERLLRGERVPTVARELFVSQSTVRNHLSAIFELFGVHSQAELLTLLRGPRRR